MKKKEKCPICYELTEENKLYLICKNYNVINLLAGFILAHVPLPS